MNIIYQVSIYNLHAHLFEVSIFIQKPEKKQIFSLPNWISGSYLIRDFAKHIVQIKACDDNGDIAIIATDKNHWQVEDSHNSLNITYQIYAFDQSVRGAFLSVERGFFNGSNLLLSVHNQTSQTCELIIKPANNWQIATALPLLNGLKNHYYADNYQLLIDAPVEMANFELCDFITKQIPHQIAISGKYQNYHPRLLDDVAKICRYHQDFFGVTPFKHYLFLLLVTHDNYGGLEHQNSSSLICARTDLPSPYTDEISLEYTKLLGLFSHEYIHAWWIKRLKPSNFHKLDLNKEVYTKQLWIFEGWTSYYDELCLVRTKLLSKEQYLSLFAKTINRVISGSACEKQSLIESSFSTWSKFYQQDENAPNSVVSYYSKGALVAFMLDIKIRKNTQNKHSLDDVVRLLWQNYQTTGLKDDDAQKIIEQLTGKDFTNFFTDFVLGVAKLPLVKYFAYLGIDYQTQTSYKGKKNPHSFNCDIKNNNYFAKISKIYDHSSAQSGGLYVGDTIIAINGIHTSYENLEKTLATYPINTYLKVSIFREGILTHLEIKVEGKFKNTAKLSLKDNLSLEQKKLQQQWFYNCNE